jgi:uncharacterized RDD family membrane protein YckC
MDPIDYNSLHSGNQIQPSIENSRIGFGKRAAAFLIDMLVTVIISVILMFAIRSLNLALPVPTDEEMQTIKSLYEMLGISGAILDEVFSMLSILSVTSVTATIAYTLIEGLTGASPGKRVMRIIVRNANASVASTSVLMQRWAAKNSNSIAGFIALVPSLKFFGVIESLMGIVIFQQSRQTLHDRIAGTAVYDIDQSLNA